MTTKYIYRETTRWDGNFPNHVYVFTEKPKGRAAKCIAYVKAGTKEVIKFNKPMDMDLRGRTFEELQ